MIQRIQSFYLLLIVALMGSMIFLPFATLSASDATYSLSAEGLVTLGDHPIMIESVWSLLMILILTSFLPAMTIFLFKRRLLQLRLCVLNAILIVVFYAVFFLDWWVFARDLDVTTSLNASLTIPIVALILNYMSYKKIRQDEDLVRSMDRIR